MGQEPAERGGEGWPAWALALAALVIIALVLAMLVWFTTGPGKGLSKPTSFSQSSHPERATLSPTQGAVTGLTATRVMVVGTEAGQEQVA